MVAETAIEKNLDGWELQTNTWFMSCSAWWRWKKLINRRGSASLPRDVFVSVTSRAPSVNMNMAKINHNLLHSISERNHSTMGYDYDFTWRSTNGCLVAPTLSVAHVFIMRRPSAYAEICKCLIKQRMGVSINRFINKYSVFCTTSIIIYEEYSVVEKKIP